jgi:hypothetical protein
MVILVCHFGVLRASSGWATSPGRLDDILVQYGLRHGLSSIEVRNSTLDAITAIDWLRRRRAGSGAG